MKSKNKSRMIVWMLFFSALFFLIVQQNILIKEDQISANVELNEKSNQDNPNSQSNENVMVTRENFLNHFTLSGVAEYRQADGMVTLTPSSINQAGSFTLDRQIDLHSSFTIEGRVNLGSNPTLGGDGIGFGFHTGGIGEIGHTGNGMGMAGLPNAFGFKLDTYYNSQREPTIKASADPAFPGKEKSFGAFVYTNGGLFEDGFLSSEGASVQEIPNPINNQFVDFSMKYDPVLDTVGINYGGQLWLKTISTWHEGEDALSFIVSGSTGGAVNLHQFQFLSMEYTPESFEGVAVPQQVTLGDSLSTKNLHSFVKDISYGNVLLEPAEYSVMLKEVENDLIGSGKATVIVVHNELGVRTEIEVPLEVTWGDTILTRGNDDFSVGAFTYHPSENKLTSNQGRANTSPVVHPEFLGQVYYSVNLHRLTNPIQNLAETANYLSHSVTGEMSPSYAVNQFSEGTGLVSTQFGDIIGLRHIEVHTEGRAEIAVGGGENLFRKLPADKDFTSFLELTEKGYQQLHFNLLDVQGKGEILKWTTDEELDAMIGEFLTNSKFPMVSIMGFSEYPDRSTAGTSVGKIVVEELLTTGNKVQYEYEVTFEVTDEPESIEVNPAVATMRTGESLQLVANVLPEGSLNTELKWTSSNVEIATVDTEGVVFGKRRGEVQISVETTTGLTDSATIQVIDLDIPPIDPTDPNPIFPKNPNPELGELSIRFVSALNFGEINVSSSEQVVYSQPTIDKEGQAIPNMITVQDTRDNSTRDEWHLTVKTSGELINGARIAMEPYSHLENTKNFNIRIGLTMFWLNSETREFASSVRSKMPGIVSLGMNLPTSQGVRLEIPPNVGSDDYSSTVIWNLATVPAL